MDSTSDIVIRPLDARKDLKEVQMLVGMSSMEQLAVANRLAYFHPATISVWLAFASVLIQVLRAWPSGSGPNGWLGYLAPIPIVACTAVPILFGIDWLHRPIFEDMLKANVGDLTKQATNQSPAGSLQKSALCLVMEYKNTPIGCLVVQPVPSTDRKSVYRITHFHVDAPYRRAGVGDDLIAHALGELGKSRSEVVGLTTRLTPYIAECLRMAGFIRDDRGVRLWDQGKELEAQHVSSGKIKSGDLDGRWVLLVDTRRTGWIFRSA